MAKTKLPLVNRFNPEFDTTFVSTLSEDETFDVMIQQVREWGGKGPLLIVGKLIEIRDGLIVFRTLLDEKVHAPLNDHSLVMVDIDKGRFAQLHTFFRGCEIGGDVPDKYYEAK